MWIDLRSCACGLDGYRSIVDEICACEPVWPSGKALGWQAEGPRFDTASALLSLQKDGGLWTLSCDIVYHFLLKH